MVKLFRNSYEEDAKSFCIGVKKGLIEIIVILSLGTVGAVFGGRFLEGKMIETQRESYQYFQSNPSEARAKKPDLAEYWENHKPAESDPMSYAWAGLLSCALGAIAVYPITNYILRKKQNQR